MAEMMTDALARSLVPPQASPFASGQGPQPELNARDHPAGNEWLEIEVPQTARRAEYSPIIPDDPRSARVVFPAGRYRAGRPLCISLAHTVEAERGLAPYHLCRALQLAKAKVVGASDVLPLDVHPTERFCSYCGHPINDPHDRDCPRADCPDCPDCPAAPLP